MSTEFVNIQPGYLPETYHELYDFLIEECVIDGTFLGIDRFDEHRQDKMFVLVILDALQQMYINNKYYLADFKAKKAREEQQLKDNKIDLG